MDKTLDIEKAKSMLGNPAIMNKLQTMLGNDNPILKEYFDSIKPPPKLNKEERRKAKKEAKKAMKKSKQTPQVHGEVSGDDIHECTDGICMMP